MPITGHLTVDRPRIYIYCEKNHLNILLHKNKFSESENLHLSNKTAQELKDQDQLRLKSWSNRNLFLWGDLREGKSQLATLLTALFC